MEAILKTVVEKITGSKKYRAVYRKTVERVAETEHEKHPAYEAGLLEESVRARLHQIWGAYWEIRPSFTKLTKMIEVSDADSAVAQATLGQMLRLHTSTRERLPVLGEWYDAVFGITGIPESIIDHGCGFMPLTIPYLGNPAYESITYTGYDVDTEQSDCINVAIKNLTPEYAEKITAHDGDVVGEEYGYADVIFMLKLVSLLEHQVSRDNLITLLKKQQCRWLVISYPQHSLGGARKGMESQYPARFKELAKEVGWKDYEERIVGGELLYVIPILKA